MDDEHSSAGSAPADALLGGPPVVLNLDVRQQAALTDALENPPSANANLHRLMCARPLWICCQISAFRRTAVRSCDRPLQINSHALGSVGELSAQPQRGVPGQPCKWDFFVGSGGAWLSRPITRGIAGIAVYPPAIFLCKRQHNDAPEILRDNCALRPFGGLRARVTCTS